MLGDLTRDDWIKYLEIPDDRIPPALIIRGTRNLKSQAADYRRMFTNVIDVGSPNGIVEDIFIGTHDDIQIAYASVYGGPMASEVVLVALVPGALTAVAALAAALVA